MKLIGLTGKIGSGKSTMLKELRIWFANKNPYKSLYTLSLDDEVAKVYKAIPKELYADLIKKFGHVILNKDLSINKDVLREQVFSSKDNAIFCTRMFMPFLIKAIYDWINICEKCKGPYETELKGIIEGVNFNNDVFAGMFTHIVNIKVPENVAIGRAMSRKNMPYELIKKIYDCQDNQIKVDYEISTYNTDEWELYNLKNKILS